MGFAAPKKRRNERARRLLNHSLGGTGKTSSPGPVAVNVAYGEENPAAPASIQDENPAPVSPRMMAQMKAKEEMKEETSSVKEKAPQAEIVPAKELDEFENFLNKLDE